MRDAAQGCWARLGVRLRAWFWLKVPGTLAFMWLFFVGYFHLLRHPAQPAFEMPLTAIDRWVDFQAMGAVAVRLVVGVCGAAAGVDAQRA